MGNMIWLGGGTKPADGTQSKAEDTRQATTRISVATTPSGGTSTRDSAETSHEVIQTPVALPDLEAAVTSTEAPLGWQTRQVWLKTEKEEYAQRHMSWLIVSPIATELPKADHCSEMAFCCSPSVSQLTKRPPGIRHPAQPWPSSRRSRRTPPNRPFRQLPPLLMVLLRQTQWSTSALMGLCPCEVPRWTPRQRPP